ncbi:hypothetical protein G6F57_016203 [Rhizopus arrhizus]|nr:hypothetical protein G6F57_016203 [Rhizopus arrhizus]
MPTGGAAGSQMIDAGRQPLLSVAGHGLCCDVGDQRGGGRCADLVCHDIQTVPGPGQTQDGCGKVTAMRRVDPAAAEHQRVAAAFQHCRLPPELGGAIDVQRAGRIGFRVRLVAVAVEDIVGGIVHQQGACVLRVLRQRGDRLRVDLISRLPIGFGLVDGGIGRRVHDYIGTVRSQGAQQGILIAQVDVAVAKRDDLAQCGQGVPQFLTNLTRFAQQ